MRCNRRNKVTFYYALYETKEPITDEWGEMTSDQQVRYGKPVYCRGNVSPAKNVDAVQVFGTELNYDKAIVMSDTKLPVDENSILWVDTLPELDEDGKTTTPHDYIVKRIAKSKNSVAIAISKVDVGV